MARTSFRTPLAFSGLVGAELLKLVPGVAEAIRNLLSVEKFFVDKLKIVDFVNVLEPATRLERVTC